MTVLTVSYRWGVPVLAGLIGNDEGGDGAEGGISPVAAALHGVNVERHFL